MTGWASKFDQPFLPQCGSTCSCSSRFVPEVGLACCWDIKQLTNNNNNIGFDRLDSRQTTVPVHHTSSALHSLDGGCEYKAGRAVNTTVQWRLAVTTGKSQPWCHSAGLAGPGSDTTRTSAVLPRRHRCMYGYVIATSVTIRCRLDGGDGVPDIIVQSVSWDSFVLLADMHCRCVVCDSAIWCGLKTNFI